MEGVGVGNLNSGSECMHVSFHVRYSRMYTYVFHRPGGPYREQLCLGLEYGPQPLNFSFV